MRRTWIPFIIPALALALVIPWHSQGGQGVALAQPGDSAAPAAGYTLSWWTVDGGGDTSVTAGKYTLGGTAGQPDAGELKQGSYTLGGGFWGGGVVVESGDHDVYLPLVLR